MVIIGGRLQSGTHQTIVSSLLETRCGVKQHKPQLVKLVCDSFMALLEVNNFFVVVACDAF